MGYSFTTALLDLRAAVGVYASRDEALLARILDGPGQWLLSRPDRREALVEIVRGGSCRTRRPHDYGYAFEAACLALGDVDGAIDSRVERRAGELVARLGGPDYLLYAASVAWGWPLPVGLEQESPLIATLPADECAQRRSALSPALEAARRLATPSEEEAESREAVEQIVARYGSAADTGRCLVVFWH